MREQAAKIKQVANIVEVISSFVQLKRAGANYVGLCPFHADKDPSFTVNESKGFFYCFGCQAGGDVISFIKRYRGCTYFEALQELANRYGIELESPRGRGAKRARDTDDEIRRVNRLAADYYHSFLLNESQALPARVYLKERSIPMGIVREQKLGYAPNKWDYLLKHLESEGVSRDLAIRAGVVVEHKKGIFRDRFRHRLIFPIRDSQGRVIAFGGRTLDENIPPKYLNSPETPIYHKGRCLYNYHIAREACRGVRTVLVVEGYLDLLRLYANDIRNAVATLGTSLTRQHVRLLGRIADEAVLIFDGDEAGIKAARRCLELFLLEQFPARSVILPEKMYPDEYISRHGAGSFKEMVREAIDLTDFFIDQAVLGVGDGIESRARCIDELLPVIKNIENPVIRGAYISRVADRLNISEEAVSARLKQVGKTLLQERFVSRREQRNKREEVQQVCPLEESVLRVLVHHPQLLESLEEAELLELYQEGPYRKMLQTMFRLYHSSQDFGIQELLVEVADGDCESLLVRLWVEPTCWKDGSQAEEHMRNKIGALKQKKALETRRNLLDKIKEAEESNDYDRLEDLLKKLQSLLVS